uniref:Ribosomal protein L6 alpha-beta domain-containing protein n=1 Tax=Leersia perrieri TaxID=77586 RepID=A0A0D9X923_9ORYZ
MPLSYPHPSVAIPLRSRLPVSPRRISRERAALCEGVEEAAVRPAASSVFLLRPHLLHSSSPTTSSPFACPPARVAARFRVAAAAAQVAKEGNKLFTIGHTSRLVAMEAKFFRFLKLVGVGFKARTEREGRELKPPEVYKGKGILYIDEVIKLKPGKKQKK